ncbi:DUF433 domain-containing protein [Chitinophaga sp. YR627]|uniref:DUF433 domain-containing protein n=1 Tax=Chitinophaga sp. YR627 TaxID=1881041 RepID=UPI0015A5D9C8|nr:DUF433 domain-containing protein [Chitinophaga sp. YR627]
MNYIERNKDRGFGQPVLKGGRLFVYNIISHTSWRERTIESFLEEFDVSIDQLKSAVSYCMNTACKNIQLPSDKYCDGCILSSIHEGWTLVKSNLQGTGGIFGARADGAAYLKSVDELEALECGRSGWMLAREVDKRLAAQ